MLIVSPATHNHFCGIAHVPVCARSSVAEQTVPAAQEINDTFVNITNVSFPDEDLDMEELGGYRFVDATR